MTLLLLIPDGVGVRNFLLGQFLPKISKQEDVHILHALPKDFINIHLKELEHKVQWHQFAPFKESSLSFLLRYSLAYAQMYWADTRAMRHNLNQPAKGSWRTKAIHRAAKIIGKTSAAPTGISILDYLHRSEVERQFDVTHYRELFRQINPSILFCSHQRPPVILPAVLAAKSLGIPTATFIFSWDNITSKGRMAAPFDHYLVWSDLMRQELLQYYPEILPSHIHVVGTAQFDPYADQELLWSRIEFFHRIGADPNRPLICYSGGDSGTCPEDPQHVEILMKLIRNGKITKNAQVILRPSPADDGKRYSQVALDHPELIYAPPAWIHAEPNNWSQVFPTQQDVQFLANLTHHADLNINVASTMTLDFAVHDKPIVNIAFDISNPPPFQTCLWDFYYSFEHYTPVVKLGAAKFARSPEELGTYINAYLNNPEQDSEGRRKLVALEIGCKIGESSKAIIQTLKKIKECEHGKKEPFKANSI